MIIFWKPGSSAVSTDPLPQNVRKDVAYIYAGSPRVGLLDPNPITAEVIAQFTQQPVVVATSEKPVCVTATFTSKPFIVAKAIN